MMMKILSLLHYEGIKTELVSNKPRQDSFRIKISSQFDNFRHRHFLLKISINPRL